MTTKNEYPTAWYICIGKCHRPGKYFVTGATKCRYCSGPLRKQAA